MANNDRKTPLGATLNRFAESKIADAIQSLGKALPASVVSVSGQIVTVKFDVQSDFTLPQVKMPIYGAEYVRMPTQVGDKGVVFPVDAYLGAQSGLGGGVATLGERANLSTLVFFPIGNTNFSAVDSQSVVAYGPNGVTLRDSGSHTTFVLTPSGIVVTFPGGGTMTYNSSGITFSNATVNVSSGTVNVSGGNVAVTGGDVTADGISLKTHRHGGVVAGGANTGTPI